MSSYSQAPNPTSLVTGMCGALVSWSSSAERALYTAPSNINGLVLLQVIGRAPVGFQPLTITLKVNGTMWGATIPLITLTSNSAFVLPNPSSSAPVLLSGQVLSVVPSNASAGASLIFDVIGYFY